MRRGGRRRRRGGRWLALALALALMWVGGEGVWWWARRTGEAQQEAPTGPANDPAGDRPPPPAAPPEQALAPTAQPQQDQDRFFGRLAAARADLRQRSWAAACAALDLVRDDPFAPFAAGAVAALENELDAALRQAGAELTAVIAAAEAPRAAAIVRGLADPPHERAQRALRELARSRGWPRLGPGDPPPDLPALLQPPPVPAGRQVGLWFRDEWLAGSVAAGGGDGDADTVTVRVELRGEVLFPGVPRPALAPVEPSPAELEQQLAAALRAKDGALARAWLACCVARGVAPGAAVASALAPWFVY